MASVIEGSGIQDSSFVNTKGTKEQGKRLAGVTRERVYQQVDSKKGEVLQRLHGLADTLQGAGKEGNLGAAQSLVDSAAQVIHRVSDRLERGSTEELVRDAQAQIRQRPGVFIAGCLAIGFLAGRFLKI
ncbi:hypothetical protein [Hyalangium minutum]|uniref:DUF883 domain-containing protein n=1 Tax=Hyalangium minutum TaxID=394096 RepID=A0A085W2N4_9BACT|nr:hypothetical protein [Hyalangium minutum]KFE61947.1 hypothetical protein DB31_4390 [Hyalangium minutum]